MGWSIRYRRGWLARWRPVPANNCIPGPMTNEAAAVCAYDLLRFLCRRFGNTTNPPSSGVLPDRKVCVSNPLRFSPSSSSSGDSVARWTEFAIAIVISGRYKKWRIYRGFAPGLSNYPPVTNFIANLEPISPHSPMKM